MGDGFLEFREIAFNFPQFLQVLLNLFGDFVVQMAVIQIQVLFAFQPGNKIGEEFLLLL